MISCGSVDSTLVIYLQDTRGRSPLLLAIASKNPPATAARVVATLIDAGADVPGCRNRLGDTALHLPLQYMHSAAHAAGLIALLAGGGADPNAVDSTGRTPLHLAVASRHYAKAGVLVALIEAGADPDARDRKGNTAAHLALLQRHDAGIVLAVIATLAQRGADVDYFRLGLDLNQSFRGSQLHTAHTSCTMPSLVPRSVAC